VATETAPKAPLPTETTRVLPQKPASGWVNPENPASVEPPEAPPEALLLIKTPNGYVKALELSKGKDLFAEGAPAREFSELLAKHIAQNLSASCQESGTTEVSSSLKEIKAQLDARRKMDEFAALLLAIALGAGFLSTVAYFVIGKIRGR
jgi:hypothetical protein